MIDSSGVPVDVSTILTAYDPKEKDFEKRKTSFLQVLSDTVQVAVRDMLQAAREQVISPADYSFPVFQDTVYHRSKPRMPMWIRRLAKDLGSVFSVSIEIESVGNQCRVVASGTSKGRHYVTILLDWVIQEIDDLTKDHLKMQSGLGRGAGKKAGNDFRLTVGSAISITVQQASDLAGLRFTDELKAAAYPESVIDEIFATSRGKEVIVVEEITVKPKKFTDTQVPDLAPKPAQEPVAEELSW